MLHITIRFKNEEAQVRFVRIIILINTFHHLFSLSPASLNFTLEPLLSRWKI